MIYVADRLASIRTIDNRRPGQMHTDRIRRCPGVTCSSSTTTYSELGVDEADWDGVLAFAGLTSLEYSLGTANRRCAAIDVEVNGAYAYVVIGAKELSWCANG